MNDILLRDAFPDWLLSGAIFTAIGSLAGYTPPWGDIGKNLDIQYIGNISGNKIVSPLVDSLLTNGTLTPASVNALAQLMVDIYGKQWGKLWATLELTYDPISNYDMTETEHSSGSDTGTVIDQGTDTGTVKNDHSVTYGKTVSRNSQANASQSNSVYGFDSVAAVPSDDQSGENTVQETETNGGTDTDTNTRTDNLTRSNTRTDDLKKQTDRTLTRTGNVGVTTSQEMIEAERKLWYWNYFNTLFADADKILTLPVY